jgi:hypothetical protein
MVKKKNIEPVDVSFLYRESDKQHSDKLEKMKKVLNHLSKKYEEESLAAKTEEIKKNLQSQKKSDKKAQEK